MNPEDETWLSTMVIAVAAAALGAILGWAAVPGAAVGVGLVWADARRRRR